ncbi:hypothetical protein Tco_1471972, partial [Tanacetum coccineum]
DSDDESVDAKNDEIQKNVNSKVDSAVEEIPENLFKQGEHGEIKSSAIKENHKDSLEDVQSDDPFNIYEFLNKNHPNSKEVHQSEGEPKYPL